MFSSYVATGMKNARLPRTTPRLRTSSYFTMPSQRPGKRRPKIKGVGSFAQTQSIKQRKADGLRRLRREPWKEQSRSDRRCIKCNVPVASSRSYSDTAPDEVCPRCNQDVTGDLAHSKLRLPIQGTNSMMGSVPVGSCTEGPSHGLDTTVLYVLQANDRDRGSL